jgi:PPOX class probable F420-dependent enzyme
MTDALSEPSHPTPQLEPAPASPAARPFIPIPEDIRRFLDGIQFATIATIDPDGGPRQAVIWYTIEGDEIVINSAVGRRWPSNLLRDPRISLSVTDAEDGYRWVGINGTVTVVEDQATAQADIAGMARRYHADDPGEAERLIHGRFERQTRISFRLGVTRIVTHFD